MASRLRVAGIMGILCVQRRGGTVRGLVWAIDDGKVEVRGEPY